MRRWGVLLLALLCTPALADGARRPRFDPFVPPALRDAAGDTATERWEPVLRATLRSRNGDLANLGGRILAVGEHTEGWRLIEVGERQAVFLRDSGDRVVLHVEGEMP